MFALAVIGIIYGAWVSTVQADMKKLVAYSSVSHLGFVVLGLFTLNPQGMVGAIIQMVNHGLSTGALFLIVGMLYERRHTRLIADYGGLWSVVPALSVLFLIVTFSSIGLPGLNGFVGEFLILVGAFQVHRPAAVLATTGIIFAAVYLLWMYQRVIFGEVTHEENRRLPDLSLREWVILVPVLVFIVWIGVYPVTFTGKTEASVQALISQVQTKAAVTGGPPMTDAILVPVVSLRVIAPAVVLALTGFVLMLLDLLPPRQRREHMAFVGLAGVSAALVVTVLLWGSEETGFQGMVVLDNFTLFLTLVIGYATGLVLLLSIDYLQRLEMESGEFYILVLFAATGMVVMAGANDLIVVFLGLETMSLALYVLAGIFRTRIEAGEASMKYFLLGAFASGFFLYGIALIYGATGSTNFNKIGAAVAAGAARDPLLLIGFGLLLVGFGFKISAVPFHMWTADVYEGAPTSVTAFIATGSKAAAFAALVRMLLTALRPVQGEWVWLFWGLAVLSMTLGNVVAIAQQNLKRMLAYSSIAHVGYMLVGIVAGGSLGNGGVLFYLLVYTFTTAGAFGVILLLERGGEEAVRLGDTAGLAVRHPLAALTLSVFLLSLVGIPPTAGFVGKFYLFGAAVRSGYIWLAVIGVLNSAVAAYYYLRVIVSMYMREPEGTPTVLAPSFAAALALVVALWGVIQLGIMPAPIFDLAQSAVLPLLR